MSSAIEAIDDLESQQVKNLNSIDSIHPRLLKELVNDMAPLKAYFRKKSEREYNTVRLEISNSNSDF
jgi:hypothetical protein